ncbi:MAG TPA: hypothetical protein VNE58_12155 [Casimicrobiaceae bacterium]|nr:hypothetical protein [Casimicrobiaceae bacterium]
MTQAMIHAAIAVVADDCANSCGALPFASTAIAGMQSNMRVSGKEGN